MKRLLQLILFSLLTFSAYSQSYLQPNSTYGFTWNRGYFPIALTIPSGDTVLNTSKTSSGALKFKTSDATLYVWDSTGNQWRSAGGAADGNNYPTSLSFGTGTGILTLGRNGLGNLTTDLDGRYLRISDTTGLFQPTGNYITALTGDGTATGPGSVAFTLATVNSNVGSFTNANITVNAKGLITAASSGTAGLSSTLADGNIWVGNASNVATAVTPSGDITFTNAGVTAIGANKVTDTMIRQSAGLSVIGNSTNSTANVADITAGTDHYVLRRSGTAIGFGLLTAEAMNPTYTNGYFLQTNGSGVLSWVAAGGGMTNPMTTRGDIITAAASGTPQRLGLGITGSVLTSDGTDVVWTTFIPYLRYIAASKSAVAADGGNGGTGTSGGSDANAYNFFIGANSGYKITSGTLNIGIGQNTLDSITTQGGHIAIGGEALGKLAAQSSTVASVGHVAIGYQALANDPGGTSQVANLAIGRRALYTLNGGIGGNTAIGLRSQELASVGIDNTSVGPVSLGAITGASDKNTAFGKETGGTQVLGSNNTYIGFRAGYNNSNASGTSSNLFISASAAGMVGNSNYNSANGNLGVFAGSGSNPYGSATSAANNVALGSVRTGGTNGPLALITTGFANIDIASGFGGSNVTTANNCISFGDRAAFANGTTNNQLNIGNHVVGNGAGSYNWNGTNTSGGTTYLPTFKTSAMMEFVSTNKGLIIPLQTTAQFAAISSKASGLLAYDTDVKAVTAYDGTRVVTMPNGLKGSATLDFGSTAAQTSADLTITVTGSADGDIVLVSPLNASADANSCYTAWVSATNTVTVRFNNYSAGAIDPASNTFKVFVIKN